MEPKTLAEHFTQIEDPRRQGFAHRYDLVEILVITTCALFSEVEGFEDIADWAHVKETWLRQFLRLKNGIPSPDTFARVFRLLDPKAFESAFRAWVGQTLPAFRQLAIDGKSLRGSVDAGKSALHMVSAFATDIGLVLGQEAVADKSNEITAIPALLEALAIKGCLVSIDAMGCQKEIASSIRARHADYLLAVKNNQPKLRTALEDAFAQMSDDEGFEHIDQGHGRTVIQCARTIENNGQVDTAVWKDCKWLGQIVSLRIEGRQRQTTELRYYISSVKLTHEQLHAAVRQHWGIENQLHWRLDVIFREDAARLRKDNGPRNIALIRKIVLNMLRQDMRWPKASIRRRRKMAGWDDNERMRVIGISQIC
jgi:predicted transposase YbfD/YdcC